MEQIMKRQYFLYQEKHQIKLTTSAHDSLYLVKGCLCIWTQFWIIGEHVLNYSLDFWWASPSMLCWQVVQGCKVWISFQVVSQI